jgi:hypothetical protein
MGVMWVDNERVWVNNVHGRYVNMSVRLGDETVVTDTIAFPKFQDRKND